MRQQVNMLKNSLSSTVICPTPIFNVHNRPVGVDGSVQMTATMTGVMVVVISLKFSRLPSILEL